MRSQDWKVEKRKAAAHARLMQRRPETRDLLYGSRPSEKGEVTTAPLKWLSPSVRETAKD